MARTTKTFDVWFVTANTVYKGVPYNVVANWTQDGRLAATDKVRPAGSTSPWVDVGSHEYLSDYVPRKTTAPVVPASTAPEVVTDHPAVVSPETASLPGTTITADAATLSDITPDGPVAELPEPEVLTLKTKEADDEDVDMIPLIDISMVLLVFFIMMRAAGALAPIDVPEMRYAGELKTDPEAITINIDKVYDPMNPDREELATVKYSVRRGASPPRPEHDKLDTPEQAIAALDELLADQTRPPEVRIACHKSLPNGRVLEIQAELEPRQKKGYINSYVATVVEAPKQ